MKKTIATVLTLILCLSLLSTAALAADPALVMVSISSEGQLVAAQAPVLAEDVDEDGVVSISDALYAAHEELYEGGAEAGYSAQMTEYGLSLEKLWGVENGGSYGYYVNNASAWSLADPVADMDVIYAYSYQDLIGWSDAYSYFDTDMVMVAPGEEAAVTFYVSGWDEEWNPVSTPCAGAAIYVCQEDTLAYAPDAEPVAVTDENGRFTLRFEEEGFYLITAAAEGMTITPPVCEILVVDLDLSDFDLSDFDLSDFDLSELDLSDLFGAELEEPLTRQMLVEALYYAEGAPDATLQNPYTDVADDNAAVLWATQIGLVNGYGDGTFGGENALTREQFAVILNRYMAYSGAAVEDLAEFVQVVSGDTLPIDLSRYPDGGTVDVWALDAMQNFAFLFAEPGEALLPMEPMTYADLFGFVENILSAAMTELAGLF